MTDPVEPDVQPAQPNPPRRTSWPPILAGLAGLAVGVLAIGGAWLATGTGSGGTGTAADSRPLTPPERVGEYMPFDQVELNRSERAAGAVARAREAAEQNSKRLSESHGGTAAFARLYADDRVRNQLSLLVYRANSPHPQYVPYQNAAELRLAKPPEEAAEFGDVSCVIRNDPTPAGRTPDPDSVHTVSCARTGGALTVEIRPTGDLGEDPRKVAALVDEVWRQVS